MIYKKEVILNENLLDEDFDLEKGIKNNEFNIIFCGISEFEDVLNEYYNMYKDDKSIRLMIRNGTLDKIQKHAVTAKIIFDGCTSHENDRGIPVLFKDKKWFVSLGTSSKKKAIAKRDEDLIRKNKRVKKFLDKVAKEYGDDITKYSNADPYTEKDKMDEIVSNISSKYNMEEK